MEDELMDRIPALAHLRNGGTSILVDLTSASLPVIVHWGRDLGDMSEAEGGALAAAATPQRVSGGLDVPPRLTLLPQASDGWFGMPGISGHRTGTDFSPALRTTAVTLAPDGLLFTATDIAAALTLEANLRLDDAGVLTASARLVNSGTSDYTLEHLSLALPVPSTALEILDTTGRHLRERSPQRHEFTTGTHLRESRRGRPGADSTLFLAAGTPGFGFENGLVHAVHLAWSGNHRLLAERTPTGEGLLMAGELLLPGEVILSPGAEYTAPVVHASWGDGLNELSARYHRSMRSRPQHPRRPRPVTLNTWEAVYFDHDEDRLKKLADAAASVGVERFVLDDGWVTGRRDDTAGLGDWYVDPAVWPNGLGPLADHVRSLGMEFGLWFEPEMVNLDSDLARRHPDWMLAAGNRTPVSGRHQQVLNLSIPEVATYLLERLDSLITECGIAYVKWDHNRELVDAGDQRTGRPAVHDTTAALYRLLAELKRRHPGLEIESCASGGARVDLGILEHTDRIWTSDCIDPIERLDIQRYTGIVVPPELMGEHISGPVSHSTRRTLPLELRAGVALFGHLGIEWNITELDDAELDRLRGWVGAHKERRELLHHGTTIHADSADPAFDLRGVVSTDRSRALFALTQVTTSRHSPAGRFSIPGLDPAQRYRVALAEPTPALDGPGQSALRWAEEPPVLTGLALGTVGLQRPVLYPEQLVLLEVTSA
jgi:alpha-galactosidase